MKFGDYIRLTTEINRTLASADQYGKIAWRLDFHAEKGTVFAVHSGNFDMVKVLIRDQETQTPVLAVYFTQDQFERVDHETGD